MRLYCYEHKIKTPDGKCPKCKEEGKCPYYGKNCPC
jgi:hypothetical protein